MKPIIIVMSVNNSSSNSSNSSNSINSLGINNNYKKIWNDRGKICRVNNNNKTGFIIKTS